MNKWPATGVIVFLYFSCSPVTNIEMVRPDNPVPEIVESSTLFPGTAIPGEYMFVTNESSFIQPYGMTFWTAKIADQSPFSQIDVSLYKVSGNDLAGYGLVFCHSLRGDPLVETMLTLMINQNQEFIIGEVVEGDFTAIIPWVYSSSLVKGYSQENRVRISFDQDSEEFSLFINDSFQMTFTDNDAPLHRLGNSGFLAVISPLDQFPQIPVEIIFQVH